MTDQAKNPQHSFSRVSCVEETVDSCDYTSTLRVKIWVPVDVEPKGIVQLVHGMAEHIDRYGEFASFLAQRGFIVVGHDHIGHGKSAEDEKDLGVMPLFGGKEILVADTHRVRLLIQSCYEDIPYFIFGHSMGSFVLRCYLTQYAEGLAGAIICGTGNQPMLLSLFGCTLARHMGFITGKEYKSPVLETIIIGSFSLPFHDEPSKFAWISSDPSVVSAYEKDPLSGIMFSTGGFATLTCLSAAASLPHTYDISSELPLLLVSGEEDSVGAFGRAPVKVAHEYSKHGVENVESRVYPGMRHEVLNEPGKYRVYNDILDWLKGNL